MDDEKEPQSHAGIKHECKSFLALAIVSKHYFRRALILSSAVVTLTLLAVLIIWIFIESRIERQARLRDVRVTVTKEGATLVIKDKETEWGMFLLSPNIPWANTGIEIRPHGEVEITASGSVCLGVAHMVQDAEAHRKPNFGWNGPDGIPWINFRARDALRETLLVMPKAPFGALLGTLHSNPTEPVPSSINPRPQNIFLIGSKNHIRNDSDHPATLWLIVNDVLFPSSTVEELALSRDAYIGPSNDTIGYFATHTETEPSGRIRQRAADGITNGFLYRSRNWETIVSNSYWHLYYDDNVGNFLVYVHQLGNSKEKK